MIEKERIKFLNEKSEVKGDYVLYWMQQSQRAEENHALEHAVYEANRLELPLLVVFGLMDDYPEANLRHYWFMLEGLLETQQTLKKRNIKLLALHGSPEQIAVKFSENASLVVCDMGYLRHQKSWRKTLVKEAKCKVVQVESDVVVPVELASDHHEYGARTIRPKLHRNLDDFVNDLKDTAVKKSSLHLQLHGDEIDISDTEKVCQSLKLDRSVKPVSVFFKGGTSVAKKKFQDFLSTSLSHYNQNRNQSQTDDISHMSMYLHFGQISPTWLVNAIKNCPEKEDVASYIEELVVRRELSMNFVHFNDKYDSYDCIPDWAKKTLKNHSADEKPATYSLEELETCKTMDPYWNAAMKEMIVSGFMHNYMRMYWGKKILEWSVTPEDAYNNCIYLNNKYFLDGRDANSYANVAWIFGLHDRAWNINPVFGKVRIMKASGLERKADPNAYVKKVDKLEEIMKKANQ